MNLQIYYYGYTLIRKDLVFFILFYIRSVIIQSLTLNDTYHNEIQILSYRTYSFNVCSM